MKCFFNIRHHSAFMGFFLLFLAIVEVQGLMMRRAPPARVDGTLRLRMDEEKRGMTGGMCFFSPPARSSSSSSFHSTRILRAHFADRPSIRSWPSLTQLGAVLGSRSNTFEWTSATGWASCRQAAPRSPCFLAATGRGPTSTKALNQRLARRGKQKGTEVVETLEETDPEGEDPEPVVLGPHDPTSSSPDPFVQAVETLYPDPETRQRLFQALAAVHLFDPTSGSAATLRTVTQDFFSSLDAASWAQSGQVVAQLLQQDFGLDALVAHQTRAALQHMIRQMQSAGFSVVPGPTVSSSSSSLSASPSSTTHGSLEANIRPEHGSAIERSPNFDPAEAPPKPLYKKTIVNESAQRRRRGSAQEKRSPTPGEHLAFSEIQPLGDTTAVSSTDYGLPPDYAKTYPVLAQELQDFFLWQTQPSTWSPEDPIRPATAQVYVRHAKLFLGWYLTKRPPWKNYSPGNCSATTAASLPPTPPTSGSAEPSSVVPNHLLSIHHIIPNADKESAECLVDFLIWLRTERQISVSYEANMLRGLTKWLKYRFRKTSRADPAYGHKTFDDIACVRELRKLHRDANKRTALAPRSSKEDRKWLSWPEYLQVVQRAKTDLEALLKSYRPPSASPPSIDQKGPDDTEFTLTERKIAIAFQKYLVLAILANIPDRQRTIRELELGRSFVKDEATGSWCIKHAPEDYKTGKTYGERPPLHLGASLTPAVDEFLSQWRPALRPKSRSVFVQVRTGNPLTQDSVYQLVARACFEYTGQRTNPHLLRDMIVTHVRENSNASEKQLEALALFMGHSIQVQRSSYDRRTLSKKVAPAVELLQAINTVDLTTPSSTSL